MNSRTASASDNANKASSNQFRGAYFQPGLVLLSSMYLAGLLGLQIPALREFFLPLVPFNLIASAVLLFIFHTQWSLPFVIFCAITFMVGFWVEVVGVHTGLIFGNYQYGATLGSQWLGVPLLIGVNWLTLIYCTGIISSQLKGSWWLQAALGAVLMVGLDILIEPIAIKLDFWQWDGKIPLQNYLAWFAISFLLLSLFHRLRFSKQNKMAVYLYLIQMLFFLSHNLFVYLI
jgi:putative membrane protein